MSSEKYIGKARPSWNPFWKLKRTLLEFLGGLRGTLNVTFEEGTWAAWLYDLLKPHVAKVLVCAMCSNGGLEGLAAKARPEAS